MIIPKEPEERRSFYAEVMRRCLASRQDRWDFYRVMRNYYLFGTKDEQGCAYNKIAATVDTLWSFVYSSDTSKFSIHLGTEANDGDLMKVKPLRDEMNDQWRASGSALTFSVGGKYSLVYGAMLFKTLWRDGKARTFIVEPHQFGVYREDVMDLDDQEAFVHCYQITKTQLSNMLDGDPRHGTIMGKVGRGTGDATEGASMAANDGMGRLILSSGINTGVGPATGGGTIDGGIPAVGAGDYDYVPRVEADLIDMYEMMIWNDEAADYQTITMASPGVVIFDRVNIYLPKMHPYAVLRPEHDVYDYFWGVSFAARLTWLQDWRTQRMEEIKELLNQQVDPPMAFSGAQGIAEEKMLAMRRAGGLVSSQMPGFSVNKLAPDLPANVFTEIQEIDSMFSDAAGISAVLQGHAQGSIRSKGQADLMARLGSSRVKQKALVVEESAARVATLMLRNVQEKSTQRFQSIEKDPTTGGALTFVADQFTNDFEVRVDSHSSSPVFVEDQRESAEVLLKAGCIDRSAFLNIMDPPNVQELQAQLKILEAQRAEAAKKKEQFEEQLLKSKEEKGKGKS